jgi:hypothetical protein
MEDIEKKFTEERRAEVLKQSGKKYIRMGSMGLLQNFQSFGWNSKDAFYLTRI